MSVRARRLRGNIGCEYVFPCSIDFNKQGFIPLSTVFWNVGFLLSQHYWNMLEYTLSECTLAEYSLSE